MADLLFYLLKFSCFTSTRDLFVWLNPNQSNRSDVQWYYYPLHINRVFSAESVGNSEPSAFKPFVLLCYELVSALADRGNRLWLDKIKNTHKTNSYLFYTEVLEEN